MASQRSFWVPLCVCFFVVMLVFVGADRTLFTKDFPSNCTHNSSKCIIWVKAEDNSSTIHYLWTTFPIPTIVVAYTTRKDVEPCVDWGKLTNTSSRHLGLRFNHPVNFTFGFALSRIYEYDDDDDKVDLNDNSYMVVHEFMEKYTTWKIDLDGSQVTYTANDSIILKFIASVSEDRESDLPHLKHTADSSRFSLSLDHMNVTTNKTRFAVEVNYVAEEGHSIDVSLEKNIDDEYSPAVFETLYGKVSGKHGKAYTQWKPVAYTNAKLSRKYQTKASAGSVSSNLVNRSWNIGEVVMNELYKVYGLNVSFGLSKDEFYQKYKYITWSGIVGYGEPAKESPSLLVILIISIGLGLPLAIIIFGGTYTQVRKRCGNKTAASPYVRIN